MPKITTNCSPLLATAGRTIQDRRRPAQALPSRYRNRPAPVRDAIARTWIHARSIGLTKSGVAVLQAILAIGYNPDSIDQPIFARKRTLARNAGVSEATVYRVLDKLKAGAWIAATDQPRLLDGSLHITELKPTEKLLALLSHENQQLDAADRLDEGNPLGHRKMDVIITTGLAAQEAIGEIDTATNDSASISPLLEDDPSENADAMIDGLRDGLRDGSYIEGNHTNIQQVTRTLKNQSTGARNSSPSESTVKRNGFTIPVELLWLIEEKQMTEKQLCKLMGMASKVDGQRLVSYVTLRSENLKQLKSNNDCYRYLAALINQKVDAEYLVANRIKQAARRDRVKRKQQATDHLSARFRPYHQRTYVGPNQREYLIDALRLRATCGVGTESQRLIRLDARVLRAIESGDLKPKSEMVDVRRDRQAIASLLQAMGKTRKANALLAT